MRKVESSRQRKRVISFEGKCGFQGQRRCIGACLLEHNMGEIIRRAMCYLSEIFPITGSLKGLEVMVAPRQGLEDLKLDH